MHPTKTDWLKKLDPAVLEIPLELPELQEIGDLVVDHYIFKPRQRIESSFPMLFWGGFEPEPPWNEVDVCASKIYVDKGFSITRIHKDGTLWMSDAPQERYMMERAAREAKGTVLVGGLGLGMYVQYALHHNKVSQVTVVELDPDIIELHRNSKWAQDPRVTIVQGEISEYIEARIADGTKYDTVYLDTHPKISDDYLPYINTLRQMSRQLLTKARNKGHGHVYIWGYHKILGMNRHTILEVVRHVLEYGWASDERKAEFHRQFPIESQFLAEWEAALPEMTATDRKYSARLIRHQVAEKLVNGFVLRVQSPKVIPLPQKKSDTIVMAAA